MLFPVIPFVCPYNIRDQLMQFILRIFLDIFSGLHGDRHFRDHHRGRACRYVDFFTVIVFLENQELSMYNLRL